MKSRRTIELIRKLSPAAAGIAAVLLLTQATMASDPPQGIHPDVSDSGSLTAGSAVGTCPGSGIPLPIVGYVGTKIFGLGPIGTYSPTGLTGGKTVLTVITVGPSCEPPAWLQVSGFSSNPGSSWLTSITCNSVTNSGSTATYSYSSGVATWHWTTTFGFTNGNNYTCSISHS